MRIKNLTAEKQKIQVKEYTDPCHEYDVYLTPHCTTEVERMFILHLDELVSAGILEILDDNEKVEEIIKEDIVDKIETLEYEDNDSALPEDTLTAQPEEIKKIKDEKKGDPIEAKNNKASAEPSEFVCEDCGAILASARGLVTHKNRVHSHK